MEKGNCVLNAIFLPSKAGKLKKSTNITKENTLSCGDPYCTIRIMI